jgi:hypothetical protein
VPSLCDHARELAAAGWAVLPCRPSGAHAKSPHTPHGHLDATTDPKQIAEWWTRWPDAMIGAAVPSTRIVIDIDPRNGGSLDELEALTGPLPATLTVHSGRGDGGRHLYYRRPCGELTSTRLPAGIDLKVNGYCILPASLHPVAGKPYVWEVHQVHPLPHAVRELLRPAPRPMEVRCLQESSAGLVRTVVDAKVGNRNRALFWSACRAAEAGVLDELEDELVDAAQSAGLSELEAHRTIESARRTA